MKFCYSLLFLLSIAAINLEASLTNKRAPRLIDQLLQPLNQPLEVNTIIAEYVGYVPFFNDKIKKTLFSRLFYKVHNQFSRDGSLCAQKTVDGHINIWDTHTGTHVRTIQSEYGASTFFSFTSSGKYIVDIFGPEDIKIWDIKTGTLRVIQRPRGIYWEGCFDMGENLLVTSSNAPGPGVYVTNLNTGQNFPVNVFPHHTFPRIVCLALSPSENFFVASDGKTIQIVHLGDSSKSGNARQLPLPDNKRYITNLALSPNEKYLAYAGPDQDNFEKLGLVLYDLENQESKSIYSKKYAHYIEKVARRLEGAGDDPDFNMRPVPLKQLFFTPDNTAILMNSNITDIMLVDLDSQSTNKLFAYPKTSHELNAQHISISPHLHYIASGTNERITLYAKLNVLPSRKLAAKSMLSVPISATYVSDRVLIPAICIAVTAKLIYVLKLEILWPIFGAIDVVLLNNIFALSKVERFALFMLWLTMRSL